MNDVYESCRKEAEKKEQEEIKKWLGECRTNVYFSNILDR